LHLQIAADVLDARQLAHFLLEDRRPVVQLRRVRVLQRELVQAPRALLAAEVDRRLIRHVGADARYLRQLRSQAGDELIDGDLALGARLQLDHHAAGIQAAGAEASATDLDLILRDVRVLRNHVGDLYLVPRHLFEADALQRLGADAESPLILARQESFRHRLEQEPRTDEQPDRDRHRHGVEAQARAPRPAAPAQATLASMLDPAGH